MVVRPSGEVDLAGGSSLTTAMLAFAVIATPSLAMVSTSSSGKSAGVTPSHGQMVYHYHKEQVTWLDHYTVTPEASSLWNAMKVSITVMSGVPGEAIFKSKVPNEVVRCACLGDESDNYGDERSAWSKVSDEVVKVPV
ncbi:hypothetical protein VNO78_10097 [Psophocarpus tetragonolobus]|uniref:Uncharacterized protein n=1 Tax=Psophocarpus tetragonolobus TaxID=3891 RepID=A0AAN9SQU3_PSOTE